MKYTNLTVTFMVGTDTLSYTEEFKNAVLMITGNHLVITEHSEDGNSITGQVFPLSTVVSYKASREE